MEITVIGDTGVVGWVAGAVRSGEIYVTTTKDMVTKVLARAGNGKISRLNILDHDRKTRTKIGGVFVNSIGIEIGSDIMNEHNVRSFSSLLQLKGHFTENGFIHLHHCYIGKNQAFLKNFAAQVGVPVYGGTGAHNGLLNVNYGSYVRCEPNGEIKTDVSRP